MSLIILFLISVGYCVGLYFWFEKAGEKGWKALVPYYRISTWVKLTNKKKSLIFWSFIPVVNLFVYAHLLGETSDSYKRYSFWEHALAIALGFIWLPFLGLNKNEKYYGAGGTADGVQKPERSKIREWADAIIFAIFAAYFIRTFVFEIYMIPTSSMEGTLRVGDFLVVSKFHYGSRVPNTPIAFPLVHHSFPPNIPIIGGSKSYSEIIKLSYKRLPNLVEIRRNDMVVFNFPANDTTTKEYDSALPYYDLVRQAKFNNIPNPEAYIKQKFTVIARPVDKRENYIKRCVAVAGDTLEIRSGELLIDGKKAYLPENTQFRYLVVTDGKPLNILDMLELDITEFNPLNSQDVPHAFEVYTTAWQAEKLRKLSFVKDVKLFFYDSVKDFDFSEYTYYPYSERMKWNVDNFGPIVIPFAGMTIPLTVKNVLLYERCIRVYEGNEFKIKEGKAFINGVETSEYTFKMNYYWMMGDNRHRSQDSRFWGFVPEDHVVGKAWFLISSFDQNVPIWQIWKKIRWDRTFRSIHGKWAPKGKN
jgi:signal peptidase I